MQAVECETVLVSDHPDMQFQGTVVQTIEEVEEDGEEVVASAVSMEGGGSTLLCKVGRGIVSGAFGLVPLSIYFCFLRMTTFARK